MGKNENSTFVIRHDTDTRQPNTCRRRLPIIMAPASSDTIISSLSSGITAARPAPQDLDKVIPNPGELVA